MHWICMIVGLMCPICQLLWDYKERKRQTHCRVRATAEVVSVRRIRTRIGNGSRHTFYRVTVRFFLEDGMPVTHESHRIGYAGYEEGQLLNIWYDPEEDSHFLLPHEMDILRRSVVRMISFFVGFLFCLLGFLVLLFG